MTGNVVDLQRRSWPELQRLYDDLESVIDKHRGAGLPHAAVLGTLDILKDELMEEKRHELRSE